jgi:hypothetical protein
MSYEQVASFVQTIGFPIALLLAIIYGLARAAQWCAPRIDDLFKTQKAFVDEVKADVKGAMTEFRDAIRDIRESILEIREHVGIEDRNRHDNKK